MERWLRFSEAARSNDTHFFCEHWRVTRASMRTSFACLYIIRRVHSNGVRRARARNKIGTFVHNTYERMLIQNIRTCRPAPTQHTTQHNSSTPTTMSKGTHLTMNPDNIQKNYGKGGTTRASRNNPQNRNGGTLYHPHRLWKLSSTAASHRHPALA